MPSWLPGLTIQWLIKTGTTFLFFFRRGGGEEMVGCHQTSVMKNVCSHRAFTRKKIYIAMKISVCMFLTKIGAAWHHHKARCEQGLNINRKHISGDSNDNNGLKRAEDKEHHKKHKAGQLCMYSSMVVSNLLIFSISQQQCNMDWLPLQQRWTGRPSSGWWWTKRCSAAVALVTMHWRECDSQTVSESSTIQIWRSWGLCWEYNRKIKYFYCIKLGFFVFSFFIRICLAFAV